MFRMREGTQTVMNQECAETDWGRSFMTHDSSKNQKSKTFSLSELIDYRGKNEHKLVVNLR